MKLVHNYHAFGKLNFQSKQVCPYCKTNEMEVIGNPQDHFITCTRSSPYKHNLIATITKELTRIKTPPKIRKVIVENITNLYYNELLTEDKEYQEFIDEQTKIGWRHLIRGRLSMKLEEII